MFTSPLNDSASISTIIHLHFGEKLLTRAASGGPTEAFIELESGNSAKSCSIKFEIQRDLIPVHSYYSNL